MFYCFLFIKSQSRVLLRAIKTPHQSVFGVFFFGARSESSFTLSKAYGWTTVKHIKESQKQALNNSNLTYNVLPQKKQERKVGQSEHPPPPLRPPNDKKKLWLKFASVPSTSKRTKILICLPEIKHNVKYAVQN